MSFYGATVNSTTDTQIALPTAGPGVIHNFGPYPVFVVFKNPSDSNLYGLPNALILKPGEDLPIKIGNGSSGEELYAHCAVTSQTSNVRYWEA